VVVQNAKCDVAFFKELFDIDDIKIEYLRNDGNKYQYDIYMCGFLVLWMSFDGEILEIAKPQNMNIRKVFVVNDENIYTIKKFIENIWVKNYIELDKND